MEGDFRHTGGRARDGGRWQQPPRGLLSHAAAQQSEHADSDDRAENQAEQSQVRVAEDQAGLGHASAADAAIRGADLVAGHVAGDYCDDRADHRQDRQPA